MKSKHYLHGGDLDSVSRVYQIDKASIWDFSGNINPLGISPKAREALKENIDLIATYPDRNYIALKEVLGTYCLVDTSDILVGNGSTELIAMAIGLIKPKKALVVGPTYSEYEREIHLAGGICEYFALQEENNFILDPDMLIKKLSTDYQMLVICNPNNPTGTGISSQQLNLILEAADKFNIFTMIDETYIEFCENPDYYLATPLTRRFNKLLVIRGISKFFASPGLRFGYGICSDKNLRTALQKLQNPWSINSLADFAVRIMLTDTDYITRTHQLFLEERKRIQKELSSFKNLRLFKPVANFILLKLLDTTISSEKLLSELVKERLLIRDASSFPFLNDKFIRFCFLMPKQNDILITTLKSLLKEL